MSDEKRKKLLELIDNVRNLDEKDNLLQWIDENFVEKGKERDMTELKEADRAMYG